MNTYTIDIYNSLDFTLHKTHTLPDVDSFLSNLATFLNIFPLEELQDKITVFKVNGVAFAAATPDDLIMEANADLVQDDLELQQALLKMYPERKHLQVLFDLKKNYPTLMEDTTESVVELVGLQSLTFEGEGYRWDDMPPVFKTGSYPRAFFSFNFPDAILITADEDPIVVGNMRAVVDLKDYAYSTYNLKEDGQYMTEYMIFKSYSYYFKHSLDDFKAILGLV